MPYSNVDTDVRPTGSAGLSMSTVLRFWFPLAASWLLMSTETPIITAVIARMPDAKLQLAAFGIAYSLSLAVESPIIAMLTAGNALARDRASLRLVRGFMFALLAIVTVGMLLLTLTPLFDFVVQRLIGTPSEIAVLVRPALTAMIPWPAAIAYRRFYQGVMIRHNYTRRMGYGTAIRLCVTLSVSIAGILWGRLDGAIVGGVALCCSVLAEAFYVHFASRLAVRKVWETLADGASLTVPELLRFYSPLALTSLIMLSTTPILSWGMARSPRPIESLAVWPVVNGQLFMVRSFGYSLQEAIIALLNRPGARNTLRRFTIGLGVGSLLALLAIAFTPLGPWWQQRIAGLSQQLVTFAVPALRCATLLPALAVIQSWLRGIIVTGKATGNIAWAAAINLTVLIAVLLTGAKLGWLSGVSLAAIALTAAQLTESVWLLRGAYVARPRLAAPENARA